MTPTVLKSSVFFSDVDMLSYTYTKDKNRTHRINDGITVHSAINFKVNDSISGMSHRTDWLIVTDILKAI